LSITGAVTNDGSIDFSDDYDKVASAVGGTGNFGLSNGASLDFASSVASGETVTFSTNSAADLLTLNSGSSFSARSRTFSPQATASTSPTSPLPTPRSSIRKPGRTALRGR
jgi:hypothetical protein